LGSHRGGARYGERVSAAVIHRNREGVLLRYADPSVRRPHHSERKVQPSDRLRISILKAELEVRILWIIAEHLDELSEIGQSRIADALRQIEAALNLARAELGLYVEEGCSTK
jgi:hypothetical protein